MIICEDLFRCEDIREVRELAKEYYITTLANTEVYNEDVGVVKFSKAGYKKPISLSGDIRKIKLFPYLREIVKTATLFKIEDDRYERQDTRWFILKNDIILDDKNIVVIINVRKDCNGNLYYDHAILK